MFDTRLMGKKLVEILTLFQDFIKKQKDLNLLFEDRINNLIDRVSVLEDEIRLLKNQDLYSKDSKDVGSSD